MKNVDFAFKAIYMIFVCFFKQSYGLTRQPLISNFRDCLAPIEVRSNQPRGGASIADDEIAHVGYPITV